MKLIPAGFGEMATPYTDLLFNCTRNQKCQRTFYVPVKLFSDIVLFTDLPGEPSLITIDVLNVCDIENEGSAVSGSYVAGTKPDGSWYAVLGSLSVTPPIGVVYHKFFFRVTFTVAGVDYIYYSQQYEFPICEELTFIRGCYPNQVVGSDAFDCNGIYYGFPNNEDFLGDHNYRYIHSAYVRLGSVIEQRNKMNFTAFNNRTTYKSVFNREWLFEQDIVPTFYKDVLIGIYNRGMVQVDGKEWKLADSQDIAMIDTDSKLWRLDIVFDEECKQSYGCKPRDCAFPVDGCTLPALDLDFEAVEDHHEGTFTGYSLLPGQSIEWEIRTADTDEVVEAGEIITNPLTFIATEVIDLEVFCYRIRWRLKCSEISFSDWQQEYFGNCDPSDLCQGIPEGAVAALFFSGAEEDHSVDTTCSGNPIHLTITHRAVFIALFTDNTLTTPILLSLNSFPIVVNGVPYNIGVGSPAYAFFVGFFPWLEQSLSGPGCDVETVDFNIPVLEANDCFELTEDLVGDGTFTLQRDGGDPLTNGYNADMRESVTDTGSGFGTSPSGHIGAGAAGPGSTTTYPATGRITLSLDSGSNPLITRSFIIVGKANDGSSGETVTGSFLLGDLGSVKTYYIDANNPITVTVDEE